GGVTCLCGTKAVAFDGLGQYHRGTALVFHRSFVSVVNFLRIKTTALQTEDFFVSPVCYERRSLWILAKKFLAHESAIFGLESLVFAIHALFHPLEQHAGLVAGQQIIPAGAPDHLDNIPSCAAESRFQAIKDLAVAPHWT